ncbi:MAG: hypothetical protein KDD64_07550 [Bdellovibrionales bacterium]|nr:hypothetical protein [Bdellovibrionales bacterium]
MRQREVHSENYFLGVALTFVYLSLSLLFSKFINSNEISKFTDAMLEIDPSWIPAYSLSKNLFVERQWLFQHFMRPLLETGGFGFAALVGRLFSFLLLAFGWISLGKALRIRTSLLIFALAVLIPRQSLVAGEWIFLGVEPKVWCYGFCFIGLSKLLRPIESLQGTAFWFGLATSVHPLVGLYCSLSGFGLLLLMQPSVAFSLKNLARGGLMFLFAGIFAVRPVLEFLFQPHLHQSSPQSPNSSFVYVFLRTPHHLDPWSWPHGWWYYAAICFSLIVLLLICLYQLPRFQLDRDGRFAVRSLVTFTALTCFPFAFGLVVRFFDHEGKILQLYLFRVADVMVPLTTVLLAAVFLERLLELSQKSFLDTWLKGVVLTLFLLSSIPFLSGMKSYEHFPLGTPGVSASWFELCSWARQNTKRDTLFITNPHDTFSFPWLARRKIVGTFKQVPLSGGLNVWYQKMTLFGGNQEPWNTTGFHFSRWLSSQYRQLTETRVKELGSIWNADYFVTTASHKLGFPVAFHNNGYTVYDLRRKNDDVTSQQREL